MSKKSSFPGIASLTAIALTVLHSNNIKATPIGPVNIITMTCNKAQYLDKETNVCIPCPSGQYMDEDDHTYSTCKWCTVYTRDAHYVQSSYSCTSTTDTVIKECIDGYYIDKRPHHYGCGFCPRCTGSSKDIEECCGDSRRSDVVTTSVMTTLFEQLTSPVTTGPAGTVTNRSTTTTTLVKCEGLNPERCQNDTIRRSVCSSESQPEPMQCHACPECRPVGPVQSGLSSHETIGIAVGCSLGGVALLVIVGVFIYCKHFKNKEYKATNRNEDDDL